MTFPVAVLTEQISRNFIHPDGESKRVSKASVEPLQPSKSLQDMFDCLLDHGCVDYSSKLDPTYQFHTPIAGGGFGDIYHGRLRDGTLVAVKALRSYLLLSSNTGPKALKVGTILYCASFSDSFRAKRAMRELYYWSKLDHNNVQSLLGIIILEGRLGVVSLWMSNGHLREYLRKNPNTNRLELVSLMRCSAFLLLTLSSALR
jgi:serine/threonine protein kinase